MLGNIGIHPGTKLQIAQQNEHNFSSHAEFVAADGFIFPAAPLCQSLYGDFKSGIARFTKVLSGRTSPKLESNSTPIAKASSTGPSSAENPPRRTSLDAPLARVRPTKDPLNSRERRRQNRSTGKPAEAVPQIPSVDFQGEDQDRFLKDLVYLDQLASDGIVARLEPDVDIRYLDRLDAALNDPSRLELARSILTLHNLELWFEVFKIKSEASEARIVSILRKIRPDLSESGTNEKTKAGVRNVILSMKAQNDYQLLMEDRGLESVRKAVDKALANLATNPSYPGLRTHRFLSLHGPHGETVFSSKKVPLNYLSIHALDSALDKLLSGTFLKLDLVKTAEAQQR